MQPSLGYACAHGSRSTPPPPRRRKRASPGASPPRRRARRGEAEAELYRLLAPRVRRYGLRHLRDAHAAADLMQHVMVLTIEQLRAGELREPERVLSFVLGTCRLTVMDQRRGERRRAELLERYADDLPMADLHVAPRLDQARVADCLERLPERERAVLVMTFYDEQPSEAVGTRARPVGRQRARDPPSRHRQAAALRRCRQESCRERRGRPSLGRRAARLLAARRRARPPRSTRSTST